MAGYELALSFVLLSPWIKLGIVIEIKGIFTMQSIATTSWSM